MKGGSHALQLGEYRVIPQESESYFRRVWSQVAGQSLRQHRDHWPYDKGCESCVETHGHERTSAM